MEVSGRQPHTRAGSASAESGIVMLDGPNGIAIAMTPDAAEETARRLQTAAKEARQQPQMSNPIPR
ncbi:MAG: hypothetical protein KF783_11765 [Sphingomonas sp.]|nr:hypothetical protein [Sphingomonas sp.]MBX3595143.1 hypothetical protein [Sphingomonas sp.]